MSGVVLATPSLAFEQRVRRAYGGELNGQLTRWHDEIMFVDADKAVRELAELESPHVVAIGPNVPVDTALDLARSFEALHPEVSVIVIAEPSPELWEHALRAGVSDVLTPDSSDVEIRRTVQRATEVAERRRQNVIQEVIEPVDTAKVITVVAPKGGSGKTALATNLAVALAATNTGSVVLVDLDLQFGDIANSLSLVPDHTMADLLTASGGLNPTMLKVFLTPRDDNLFVLCAPVSPEDGEKISDTDVERMIRLLAAEFDYVVVDTAAGLTEATLAAIELSTDLMLICDLSVSAVRGMRKVVDALDRLDMTRGTRHFVLNRADSKVGVDAAEAAAVMGMPVSVELPSARAVPLSMNQGRPVVETAPRSPVAKRFMQAALVVANQDENGSRSTKPRRWRGAS
jgi:pilus assembly protein CpaE